MLFRKYKETKFQKELDRARYTSVDGKIISLHHAFQTIRFTRSSKLSVLLLPPLFMMTIWFSFGSIAAIWEQIMRFWMGHLFPGTGIGHRYVTILWHGFMMPVPQLGARYPTELEIFLNFFATIIIFMFSTQLFKRWAPFVYLLRAAMMVQWSAALYFIINPDHFPYPLHDYVVDMLSMGLYLLFLIPLVFAALLYIFDFPLWWKLVMTLVTIAFFIVFLPCQYFTHAWIVHKTSYMFFPLLYFMFAVLVDVLMFICFYSIAIAWSPYRKQPKGLGRYA